MSRDRIIRLLTDEEISCVLTGLRVLSQEYVKQDSKEDVFLCNRLYEKIDNCVDMGVIGNERI